MSWDGGALLRSVQTLYDSRGWSDVPFDEVLSAGGLEDLTDDEALADLIEADGRTRLRFHLPTPLDRYLDAIDDLRERSVALDAAIEFALRDLSCSSQPTEQAVEALIRDHPELVQPIREAAMLSAAIWSTRGLHQVAFEPPLRPPCGFGPRTPAGKRRFEVRRVLGTGASGHVYAAVDRLMSDEDHEAVIALKVHFGTEETEMQRLLRADEATRTRRIDHPNVIRVLDRGIVSEPGKLNRMREYIVYEYVEGEDLSVWLERNRPPLPPREAATIVAEIARGVQAAHSAGLIHCDLKPDNIMRSVDGRIKVSDFGVAMNVRPIEDPPWRDDPILSEFIDSLSSARRSAVAGESEVPAHPPIGNLAFISPEQFRGEDGAISPPSDIYAIGGILFLLLTGELPNGGSLEEIRANHHPDRGRTRPPDFPTGGRPRRLRERIDPELREICHRAMAPRPEDRYESAGALAGDLEAWMHGETIYWQRPSLRRRLGKWMRRKPVHAGLVVTGLLALLLSVVVLQQWRVNQAAEEARTERLHGHVASFVAAAQTRSAPSQMFVHDLMIRLIASGNRMPIPGLDRTLWLAKMQSLLRYIDEAEQNGFGNDIAVQMIKYAAAVALLAEGELDDASRLIDDLLEVLPQRIPADDSLHADLAATAAARDVIVLAREAEGRAISVAEHEEVRRLIPHLRERADHYERRDLGSGLHRLYLHALQIAYGPDLLDDEAMHARLRSEAQGARLYNPLFMHVYDEWKELFDQQWADEAQDDG